MLNPEQIRKLREAAYDNAVLHSLLGLLERGMPFEDWVLYTITQLCLVQKGQHDRMVQLIMERPAPTLYHVATEKKHRESKEFPNG